MSNHNKNAATEDQVGYLHKAVTMLFTKKADALLEAIEEDPEQARFIVEGKDIAAMAKWVLDNGITATPAASQENSALSKRLADLKAASQGKVIAFAKEV